VYVLIDHGTTHLFVARRFENILSVQSIRVEKSFVISTYLGEVICVGYIYIRVLRSPLGVKI
jgi:hypothetical protein